MGRALGRTNTVGRAGADLEGRVEYLSRPILALGGAVVLVVVATAETEGIPRVVITSGEEEEEEAF